MKWRYEEGTGWLASFDPLEDGVDVAAEQTQSAGEAYYELPEDFVFFAPIISLVTPDGH